MSEIPTIADLNRELLDYSHKLDEALDELAKQSRTWATAKRDQLKAEARAYAAAKAEGIDTEAGRSRVVRDRTIDERFAADMADALKESAALAVRARMTQISARQSVGSGTRTEMQMAGRFNT